MQDTNYEMNMTQLFREKSEDKYSRIKKGRNKKKGALCASKRKIDSKFSRMLSLRHFWEIQGKKAFIYLGMRCCKGHLTTET